MRASTPMPRGRARLGCVVALLVGSSGCSIDVGALLFACADDADCGSEQRCHPVELTCHPVGCGDAVLDDGERCDDGNTVGGDGCDARCALEAGAECRGTSCAVCGDGAVTGFETCDDGNRTAGDGCDARCGTEPGYTCAVSGCYRCGDGTRDPGEDCDEGEGSGACVGCRVPLGADCAGELGEPSVCFAIRVRKVAAGEGHTCLIDGDAQVRCAGRNTLSPTSDRVTGQATPPADLPPVMAIAAGYAHTCAVTAGQGRVVCWGSNLAFPGEDADLVTTVNQATPPADLPPARDIAAGNFHTCAVLEDDTVRCWGSNASGRASPPAVPTKMIALGSTHSCGVRADQPIAFCFGESSEGRSTPPEDTYQTLDTGLFHACGVTTAGTVRCWGRDTDPPTRTVPPPGSDYVEVAAGHYYSCARRRDGTLRCWGKVVSSVPGADVLEPPQGPFSLLVGGFYHACAIRPDGPLECWGDESAYLK